MALVQVWPAGQGPQVVRLALLTVVLEHAVHAELPAALMEPYAQGTGALAGTRQEEPAGQVVHELLPAALKEPAEQEEHEAAPAAENCPGAQA